MANPFTKERWYGSNICTGAKQIAASMTMETCRFSVLIMPVACCIVGSVGAVSFVRLSSRNTGASAPAVKPSY